MNMININNDCRSASSAVHMLLCFMMLDCKPHFLICISGHIFHNQLLPKLSKRARNAPVLTEDRDEGKQRGRCELDGEGKQYFTFTVYLNT